jgi:UDP-N-acetylmuramoylalanine--D-glutamate ligase
MARASHHCEILDYYRHSRVGGSVDPEDSLMHPRSLKSKRVLIVGYGATGASVARFLKLHSINFAVADEGGSTMCRQLAISLDCAVHEQFTSELFEQFSVLVLSPGVPRSHFAVQSALEAGVDVVGDIELFASVVDAPVIAVTGSNGKSTVVSWVTRALQGAGIKAIACGNIGLPALDSLHDAADVYVLELSSYQLESTRSLKPLAASVLNVSDDHLDRYSDIEHYAAVKRSLYAQAEHCVVNQDDPRTWPQLDDELSGSCERFTLSLEPDVGTRWHRTEKEGHLWLCDDHFAFLAQRELSVPGDHNVANALAALALIEPLEIPFTALREGIVGFYGLPHRSEYLGESSGVRWYNDSKGTNIDACCKAIQAMPGPVVLIAGGISKGADFSLMRDVVSEHVKLVVLIGRDRLQIRDQLDGSVEIVLADDLRDAVITAKQHSDKGDVVLLSPACSSFDMFRNFEDRGEQFAATVEEVLAA